MSDAASDLVIVGGGLAGLVAGARASELGLAVTVLERGTDHNYPCNTRWSGGVIHIAYTDITSPPETLRSAIKRDTQGKADASQTDAVSANGARFIDWLRGQGSTFVRTEVDWQQLIREPMRDLRAGLDWENRGPDQLLARLTAAIERGGGEVVLGARGRSLVVEDDRCAGVEATVNGAPHTFPADAVVLADGGFQGNLERLGQHITPRPERIKQRGPATGTGDGLAMAEAVGASITSLNKFYGHLLSRDAFGNDNVWPYPEVDAMAFAGILVDSNGHRFTDEGLGGIAMANALSRSDEPLGATVIFDAAIWDGPGRSARIPANPTLVDAGGTVLTADSIEKLALLAKLPPSRLVASVASYNSALEIGALTNLHPQRTDPKHVAMPIAAPPFHAIPVCAGITYTMGGILVDGDSRILRSNATAVEGLYAAGSSTGGLEGDGDVAYIGGLAKAGIQGLIAAESIARSRGLPV
jgi:fumarate reductase flavoprotein subunit